MKNLLTIIDKIHNNYRKKYLIPDNNQEFSSYIPVKITAAEKNYHYLIWKRDRARLLLLCGEQRIYLSDAEIIETILRMDKAIIEWLLCQFIALYQNKGYQMVLAIDKLSFKSYGIMPYPKQNNMYLFSDSLIDMNYFVFALNFIFYKDRCWEEIGNIEGFGKTTLCKFITLIDYYHNYSKRSKRFLDTIGFPETAYLNISELKNNKIRKLFKEVANIKRFDISDYIV